MQKQIWERNPTLWQDLARVEWQFWKAASFPGSLSGKISEYPEEDTR